MTIEERFTDLEEAVPPGGLRLLVRQKAIALCHAVLEETAGPCHSAPACGRYLTGNPVTGGEVWRCDRCVVAARIDALGKGEAHDY